MAGERKALARQLINRDLASALLQKHGGRFHGPHVEHLSMEEQAFWRFLEEYAAGWRPPPEPQADLPSLAAESRPARFRLRVTETPPPSPITEPQAAASEVVGRAVLDEARRYATMEVRGPDQGQAPPRLPAGRHRRTGRRWRGIGSS